MRGIYFGLFMYTLRKPSQDGGLFLFKQSLKHTFTPFQRLEEYIVIRRWNWSSGSALQCKIEKDSLPTSSFFFVSVVYEELRLLIMRGARNLVQIRAELIYLFGF
jgi:hypothetical protein